MIGFAFVILERLIDALLSVAVCFKQRIEPAVEARTNLIEALGGEPDREIIQQSGQMRLESGIQRGLCSRPVDHAPSAGFHSEIETWRCFNPIRPPLRFRVSFTSSSRSA